MKSFAHIMHALVFAVLITGITASPAVYTAYMIG